MRSLLNEYHELTETSVEQKIQKALGKYQFDQAALADYIGAKAKDVAKSLAKMSASGQVVKIKTSGVWKLHK